MSYHWHDLRYYINGKKYDEDSYPPVYTGDKVKITGYLYKDFNPAPNEIIECRDIFNNIYTAITNSRGYFEFNFTVGSIEDLGACDERMRLCFIKHKKSGRFWDFSATGKCRFPDPVIAHAILRYGNNIYEKGEKVRVPKGATLNAQVQVRLSRTGWIKITIYDITHKKTLKEKIVKQTKSVDTHSINFKVNESCNVKIIAYGCVSGGYKCKYSDEYGC